MVQAGWSDKLHHSEWFMTFWENRLKRFGIDVYSSVRFGESYLEFQDPDGLELELVERNECQYNWNFGGVQAEMLLKGLEELS